MTMPIRTRGGRRYRDRREAGRLLADRLSEFAGRDDVVVLGLPRGGVPVAFEVANAIGAPLDVFVVRKLGMPNHPEFAMGAIASGGVRVLSDDLIRGYRIPSAAIEDIARREQIELERRERAYRGGRPPAAVSGRTVILVDDGLATGSTMRAAVLAIRRLLPAHIVVAVPVGAPESCRALDEVADDVICATMPDPLTAVGLWYENFEPTTDDEVRQLMVAAVVAAPTTRSA